MMAPSSIASEHEAFLRRLALFRAEPGVLEFDHEMAGLALAIGILVGGGFPYWAAVCARAAELAWPEKSFPWEDTGE